MPAQYQWLDFKTARDQLSQRLYDPNKVWTTDAELGIYITMALRLFNCLTNTWKSEFTFNPWQVWNSLQYLQDSPRVRSVTDVDCYTQMEYMLLEPPTGATWTGTPQFDISNLSQALQRRRDEVIKITNCNQQLMPGIALTPNTRRTVLPDNVIEVARVRYIFGSSGYGGGGYGLGGYGVTYGGGGYGEGPYGGGPGMITLYRDDTVAQEFYEAGFWQEQAKYPQTFMLSSEPPLAWDVDIPPAVPGTYEAVVLLEGDPFSPLGSGYGSGGYGGGGYGAGVAPATTLLNIPDDYSWMLIWGAMADLLGRESEATDRERADYALKRYLDGLKLLMNTPWIMLAKINGDAVNVESIANMDRYMPEWDSYPFSIPCIVSGGIDFFACPISPGTEGTSIGLTVLGNAPVPVADDDWVQVSEANWDTVLDLAQVFADWKMGGAEWQAAVAELETRALQQCAAENTRLKSTGAFSDILMQRAQAEDRDQERYSTAGAKNANSS